MFDILLGVAAGMGLMLIPKVFMYVATYVAAVRAKLKNKAEPPADQP